MKPADLSDLLAAVHREKETLRRQHAASARRIRGYDANNAYQYVIAREEVHLAWLAGAIADLGGATPSAAEDVGPSADPGAEAADEAALARADARALGEFLDRWQGRISGVTNARHRLMLDLLVGETREQARVFEQAATGRADMLGRRTAPSPAAGVVLPVRWVE